MARECDDCPCFERLLKLEAAFPEGPEKHYQVHESWAKAKKAEEEFWQQLKLELAKKGAIGFLYLVGALLLLGIATKLGLPIKP